MNFALPLVLFGFGLVIIALVRGWQWMVKA